MKLIKFLLSSLIIVFAMCLGLLSDEELDYRDT